MTLLLFRRFLPYIILLIAAIFVRESTLGLGQEHQQLLKWLPYFVLAIAMILCVYYNHARLFTITLVLLLSYYFIQTELQTSLNEVRALYTYSVISLLIPTMLLIFLFIPERGLRNRYGILILSFVPLFLVIGFSLFNFVAEEQLLKIINENFSIRPVDDYLLSINASIAYFIVLIAGILCIHKNNNEYYAVLITTLVFVFFTLQYFDRDNISVVMFSFIGACMIFSLMRGAYDMAYRDDLTGLLGRRALNERLKGLGKRYLIAMLDVDHFKKFNDTHGHDIGDEVLKMVARNIAAVKGGGTAYRYGGEEFCIIFSGKDFEYCKPYLEEIRMNIENYKMTLRDVKHRTDTNKKLKERRGRRSKNRQEKTVSVTISIGVAVPNGKYIKVHEVLKAADTALYKAKNNGRNCLATI
jgi:diguanylate cyclase (GGDEF)-like protein